MVNKKGTVGEIIIWVFAFLVVFLLTIIFLFLAGYFAGYKKVTFSGDKIKISEGDFKSLEDYRVLPVILNYYSDEGIPIKKDILENNFDEQRIKNLFETKLKDDYYFSDISTSELGLFQGYNPLHYSCAERQYVVSTTDPTLSLLKTSLFFINKDGEQRSVYFVYLGKCQRIEEEKKDA